MATKFETVFIYGQHRNFALAERHRKYLEKINEGKAEIVARRTAAGQFSSRGQHFTFRVQIPIRTKEWAIKTEYKPKTGGGKGGKRQPLVLTDIRVITPADWTAPEVKDAIQRFAMGEAVEGLTVKAFDWARGSGATSPDPAQVGEMGRFAAVFLDADCEFDILEIEGENHG